MGENLSEPARLLLLASLLSNERIISNNGKAFLKEMVLRRDLRLSTLLTRFEGKEVVDASFIEQVHEIIRELPGLALPCIWASRPLHSHP